MENTNNTQITYPLDFTSQEILTSFIRSIALIPPQYTTAIRDTLSPTKGMVIYNTTTNKLNFYNGSAWEAVTSA
jgi:hypothetical protein